RRVIAFHRVKPSQPGNQPGRELPGPSRQPEGFPYRQRPAAGQNRKAASPEAKPLLADLPFSRTEDKANRTQPQAYCLALLSSIAGFFGVAMAATALGFQKSGSDLIHSSAG